MHRLNCSAPAYQKRVIRVEFQQFGLLNRQKGLHEGSNARLHRLLRLLQSLPTLLRQGPKTQPTRQNGCAVTALQDIGLKLIKYLLSDLF
jgi:hypothetical protein